MTVGRRVVAGALALMITACGTRPTVRPRHDGGDAGASGAGPVGGGDAAAPGPAAPASPVAPSAPIAPTTPDGAAAPYRLARLGAGDLVVDGGTIAVTVTWPDAPAAVRASPGVTACSTPRRPRATIGALHGVAGVVVVLDGVAAGKRPPAATPLRLTVRDCALEPAVAVLPRTGGSLEVQAQDDAGHTIAITDLGPALGGAVAAGEPVVTRARLPVWGHTVALPLPAAGVRRVQLDDADDAAHVVVTDQPYAAVTGEDGAAALEQVPAGTYAVVAWLPPAAGQPAITARGEVTVVAGDRVELTLRLAP